MDITKSQLYNMIEAEVNATSAQIEEKMRKGLRKKTILHGIDPNLSLRSNKPQPDVFKDDPEGPPAIEPIAGPSFGGPPPAPGTIVPGGTEELPRLKTGPTAPSPKKGDVQIKGLDPKIDKRLQSRNLPESNDVTLTASQLQHIILEEVYNVLNENAPPFERHSQEEFDAMDAQYGRFQDIQDIGHLPPRPDWDPAEWDKYERADFRGRADDQGRLMNAMLHNMTKGRRGQSLDQQGPQGLALKDRLLNAVLNQARNDLMYDEFEDDPNLKFDFPVPKAPQTRVPGDDRLIPLRSPRRRLER